MGSTERPRRVIPAAEPIGKLRTGTDNAVSAAPLTGRQGLAADRWRNRPAELLAAVTRLDARLGPEALRETARWLREHYTASYGLVPLGFVAQCFLGPPYVDHRLSLDGVIIDHFAAGEAMPEPFGAARMLARSGAYAFVEVYSDGLILPVLDDGGIVRP
ncbi:hypothetical protein OG900_10560 [Streptomyces sp. NBC_00433]